MKNNLLTHSTVITKKAKNTSPITFPNKHQVIAINQNETNDQGQKEGNLRRAHSFITSTNSNKNIEHKAKENIIKNLHNKLNKILLSHNIKDNELKYKEALDNIVKDKNYDIEKINIKFFDNNDFFIGLLDQQNKFPLKGILIANNGDYYDGEFLDGKKNGKGSIIYKNGIKYSGTFKNDKHDGYGKLIQLNGEIYEGQWKNGKIHGKGIRLHSNGDKYIGNYVNNVRNGEGQYFSYNGDSYKGNFVNGKANGVGVYYFRNGNIYEGEMKNNIITGNGTFKMKNGDVYIGYFINKMINGKGTFVKNNGEKYVGNFVGGMKNGEGKLFDVNGNIIAEGIWKNDEFYG